MRHSRVGDGGDVALPGGLQDRLVAIVQQDKELLAAVAIQPVALAAGLAKSVGHSSQGGVAGQVTHGVVEALETVEVHEEQAHRAPVPLDPGGRLGQVFVQAQTVAQAGERVHSGDRFELFVEAQQLGLLDDERLLLHEEELVLAAEVDLVFLHSTVEAAHGEELAVHLLAAPEFHLVGADAHRRRQGHRKCQGGQLAGPRSPAAEGQDRDPEHDVGRGQPDQVRSALQGYEDRERYRHQADRPEADRFRLRYEDRRNDDRENGQKADQHPERDDVSSPSTRHGAGDDQTGQHRGHGDGDLGDRGARLDKARDNRCRRDPRCHDQRREQHAILQFPAVDGPQATIPAGSACVGSLRCPSWHDRLQWQGFSPNRTRYRRRGLRTAAGAVPAIRRRRPVTVRVQQRRGPCWPGIIPARPASEARGETFRSGWRTAFPGAGGLFGQATSIAVGPTDEWAISISIATRWGWSCLDSL